eukprot:XP_011677179.1 PREDICTED: uncharacterized protein LOC105444539 [Strongylocentrotus purpuratus]
MAECTRLQAATCDLQQDNWDLKQKLSDVKHKLQTEKQLRKLLEQRYDDELNDIKMKTTLLEDHEKERGVLQSKEIQRKLSKLEHRLQKQEVQPVNISDDQREIRGLKSEIAKLGSLRDLDREALDGLTADLGAIKGLMTSEIQQATNQNSADKLCRPESHSSRVQQALRKAELSAIRTTSFPSTQSETNILLAQSDDLIRGLKSEIAKLGSLRDLDREALDGLTADLGTIKGLMTSEIKQATNQNSADKSCRPESHSSRVQQALRKAELSAIRMTSFSNTQSDTNILLGQSDDLADVATSDS